MAVNEIIGLLKKIYKDNIYFERDDSEDKSIDSKLQSVLKEYAPYQLDTMLVTLDKMNKYLSKIKISGVSIHLELVVDMSTKMLVQKAKSIELTDKSVEFELNCKSLGDVVLCEEMFTKASDNVKLDIRGLNFNMQDKSSMLHICSKIVNIYGNNKDSYFGIEKRTKVRVNKGNKFIIFDRDTVDKIASRLCELKYDEIVNNIDDSFGDAEVLLECMISTIYMKILLGYNGTEIEMDMDTNNLRMATISLLDIMTSDDYFDWEEDDTKQLCLILGTMSTIIKYPVKVDNSPDKIEYVSGYLESVRELMIKIEKWSYSIENRIHGNGDFEPSYF